jgi:DNA-binding MarR family transcriptional regulator
MREECLDGGLFADPAWDMLLDLFAARLEERSVSVSSLCVAAAVPSTTALRWINILELKGHVRKRADPKDRRRIYVEITETTTTKLAELLAAGRSASPLL